jgi:hypothetical protein
VHAVATRSDRRHRGLARACLSDATRWIDERFSIAKLSTHVPAVYAPHGFRPLGLHHFAVDHAGGEDRGRPLRADTERAWFLDLCARRDPVSHRFASRDPGGSSASISRCSGAPSPTSWCSMRSAPWSTGR